MKGRHRGDIFLFRDFKREFRHIERRVNVNYIVFARKDCLFEFFVESGQSVIVVQKRNMHAFAPRDFVRLNVFIIFSVFRHCDG